MLSSLLEQACASARDNSTDEEDSKLLNLCKAHVKSLSWSSAGKASAKYSYTYDDEKVTIHVPNDDGYTIKKEGGKKFEYSVDFPKRPPMWRTWDKQVPDSCRLAVKMCQTGWTFKKLASEGDIWELDDSKITSTGNNKKKKRGQEEDQKQEQEQQRWIWMYEDNGWECERWYFSILYTAKTAPALASLEECFARYRLQDLQTKRKAERAEYERSLKSDPFGLQSVKYFGSVEVAVPTYFGLVKDWIETTEQVDNRVDLSNNGYLSFWSKISTVDEQVIIDGCATICKMDNLDELIKGGLEELFSVPIKVPKDT